MMVFLVGSIVVKLFLVYEIQNSSYTYIFRIGGADADSLNGMPAAPNQGSNKIMIEFK